MKKKLILGLVGPTASGKTAVSLLLAKKTGGEIVCMDSMQIYRCMDKGTAKPTQEERAAVPHHMIDVADPGEAFSVTEYAALAKPLLDRIPCPILVGGTGFYLRALSLPMDYGYVRGDEKLRSNYQQLAMTQGTEALHDILKKCDPVSAARLHPNDVRRVIRALEVFDLTGKPFSAQVMPDESDSPYQFLLFGLDWPREALYERIDARVDAMLADGLLDEVDRLLKSGVPEDAQSMQGLGYKELIPVLKGEASLAEAAEMIKRKTRNYAKRQLTWFRHDDRVHWIAMDSQISAHDILARIESFSEDIS